MLAFEQLSHQFGARVLFSNLNLAITQPRVVLTGANGMGKTTLLLIAAGVLKPSHGAVLLDEQNVEAPDMRRAIGISASKVSLPGFFSVSELLDFQARQFNCEASTDWIDVFGLRPFLHTKVQDLSLGNYKKLSLIMALMHQPKLLLLDEPTNGLDGKTRDALDAFFIEYPGQLVIASHEPNVFNQVSDVRHLHLDAHGVHER